MPPRYKKRSVNCGRRLVKLDRSLVVVTGQGCDSR